MPRVEAARASLPSGVEELVALAKQTLESTRSPSRLAVAAVALHKARQQDRMRPEVARVLAEVYVALAEVEGNAGNRRTLARRAVRFAERATLLDPEHPDSDYLLGAAWGMVAAAEVAPGRDVQARIEAPLLRLAMRDPGHRLGGALRILGTLYVAAPPWPAGVGDAEEGLELLERAAAEYPGHPLNHHFLGKAQLKLGRDEQARQSFLRVLSAQREGEWAVIGGPFREEARQLLRDASRR